MGDMLHHVLNAPMPDSAADMGPMEWLQFRDRAREASRVIRAQEAEIARLSMLLEAVKAWAEGKPSNPPKTGIAPTTLNPEPTP